MQRTIVFLAVWLLSWPAFAELKVRLTDQAPPTELGASIRETLQSKSLQVLEGDQPVYEFWFRKEIALKSSPPSPSQALTTLTEAAVVGAVLVHRPQRDYRDDEIAKGLYTLRAGFQPQDGDHLGTAPFPFFLVMIQAKTDQTLDGFKTFKPMVKASGSTTSSGHPNILSLRPPTKVEGDAPRLTEPEAEHVAVYLKLPARVADAKDPIDVALELVVQGHTSHL